MAEYIPQQPEEKPPRWPELEDEDLADEYKDMFRDLLQIDETKFWEDGVLERNLQEDASLAASIYFGSLLLLQGRGFLAKPGVVDRFNELTGSFTEEKHRIGLKEQAADIRKLREYLLSLGCTSEEISAKETLRRVMLAELNPEESGWMKALQEIKADEGIEALKKIASESPALFAALQEFDREAKEREQKM
ncbi:MAG: hypothetical protein HYW90_05210 [Candidatus Sungbacteria bacterium]|nr:hypothetical protein [Candidatus Sungbacteria bacterium]